MELYQSFPRLNGIESRRTPILVGGFTSDRRKWRADPDPATAVLHAVPHHVVSQILRPDFAAFLPPASIQVLSEYDARCSISAARIAPIDEKLELSTVLQSTTTMVVFLARLPHLTSLDLTDSDVDGTFLSAVSRAVPSLRELSLSGCNRLHDADLKGLAGTSASTLVHLDVSCCDNIGAPAFVHIGRLGALKLLDVSFFGPFSAASFAPITQLTALQHLCLNYCSTCEPAAFAHLQCLPNFTALSLRSSSVTRKAFHFIGGIRQLQFLDLGSGTNVDSQALADLERLSELRALDVSDCGKIDTAGFSSIGKLTNLRALVLQYCEVDGERLSHLRDLRLLESLDLDSALDGDGEGLGCLPPSLRNLNLTCSYNLAAPAFVHIGRLTQLRTLVLNGCALVGADALAELAALRELTELDLSSCPEVDAAALRHVVRLPWLRTLNVQDCGQVDAAARAVLASVPTLLVNLDG